MKTNVPERNQRRRSAFSDHPFLVIWELTQACDLVCAHCRACAQPKRDDRELSTGEGFRLLDDIAQMGTPLVVLTGGDPAKRTDLVDLVRYGAGVGLSMAVTPSATPLMTHDLLLALRDAGLSRLAVSLDDADPALHDQFRGVSGSFAESMRIMHQARALGIELQVNTSVGPHNVKRLDAMAALARELGVVLWSVFFVVPMGRANATMQLSAEETETVLHRLSAMASDSPFDIKTTAAPHFRRVLLEEHTKASAVGIHMELDEDGLVIGPRGINDGLGFLFVSHRGDIYPSGLLPASAGNVRNDALAHVYRTHPMFQALRDADALLGKCGACPFRKVCGGSRARAYAMTGDYLEADPLCAYVPKGYTGKLPKRHSLNLLPAESARMKASSAPS